jgi:hypothetical protein
MLGPAAARLGSAQSMIGQGSIDDGLVTISYQLPVRRHGKAPAGIAPARALVATSDEQ